MAAVSRHGPRQLAKTAHARDRPSGAGRCPAREEIMARERRVRKQKNNNEMVSEPRWRIEHAQNITPIDQKRYVELNVIPAMQPSHAIGDLHFAIDRLGLERINPTHLIY